MDNSTVQEGEKKKVWTPESSIYWFQNLDKIFLNLIESQIPD